MDKNQLSKSNTAAALLGATRATDNNCSIVLVLGVNLESLKTDRPVFSFSTPIAEDTVMQLLRVLTVKDALNQVEHREGKDNAPNN